MFFIYDLFYLIFVILYMPIFFLKGKWHGGIAMRFGFWPESTRAAVVGDRNIWIHAVSVGETLAVQGLIGKLKETYPNYKIIFSTVTKTGYKLAKSKLKDVVVIYAPLDFSSVVRQYIGWINPKIYITAETEIWPNLFLALYRHKVKILLINGRISTQSFGSYQKVKFFLRKILDCVNIFCMQSQADAQRIVDLGAPQEKVRIVGNMKFDEIPHDATLKIEDLGFKHNESLWIAGSTHPGEERIAINIYKTIGQKFSNLRLIIAPRHIERTEDIMKLVREKGLLPVRFSQIQETPLDAKTVVIVDTIGHLRSLYSLAKIVFVGKSLTGRGGQNIIEPASFAKPIFVGPHTQNFKDIVELFVKSDAIVQVRDAEDLRSQVTRLLRDSNRLQEIGLAAKSVVEKSQGATDRTEEIVAGQIESGASQSKV